MKKGYFFASALLIGTLAMLSFNHKAEALFGFSKRGTDAPITPRDTYPGSFSDYLTLSKRDHLGFRAPLTMRSSADKTHLLVQWGFEANAANWDSTFLGRTNTWLDDMYTKNAVMGSMESSLGINSFLKAWTIEDIQQSRDLYPTEPQMGAAKFYIVKSVGASGIPFSPFAQSDENRNAIVQVASQFNFLESPNTRIAPVEAYTRDGTQGPMLSVEAAAASLGRYMAVTKGFLPHALSNIFEDGSHCYTNGYLELNNPNCAHEKADTIEMLMRNLNQIKVLPQWVTNERTGTPQLQVFVAAPSFQGYEKPSIDSDEGAISAHLMTSQYAATANIAVILAEKTGKPVFLNLTFVGQGAYNNPAEIKKFALQEIARVLNASSHRDNIHVFVHAYGGTYDEVMKIQSDFFEKVAMTKEEYRAGTLPDSGTTFAQANPGDKSPRSGSSSSSSTSTS